MTKKKSKNNQPTMARPPAPINGAPASAKSASTRSPPAPLVSLGKVANSSKSSNGNSKNAYTFSFPDSNDNITTSSSSSSTTTLGKGNTNCSSTTTATTHFYDYREKHIRPLMDLNDRVNALTFQETQVNATRIVVAGDQSHGKTSLLEALCGVDLPRGEGIVTRVPLILQLRQCQEEDEYACISVQVPNVLGGTTLHKENISLDQVGSKVREYTTKAAGKGKNIVDCPIEVKIFRNSQEDNLTLVDLPGITRVALPDQAGGNGKLLEAAILKMCERYMAPKESILLNVVSAMVDFSTSASLQLSHELDKERTRTMLCITKVDQHSEAGLHDKITKSIHAMNLKPQHVFAVRNRTQEENEQGMPLSQVRCLETTKLEKLTDGKIPEYQLGVKALSKYLVKIQCEEILKTLPCTRNAIKEVTVGLEKELEGLGEPVGNAAACKAKAVQLIDACTNRLEGEASGRVHMDLNVGESCEGEAFELSLTIDGLESECGEARSTSVEVGEFSFMLYAKADKKEDKASLDPYLQVSQGTRSGTANVSLTCTFSALHGDEVLKTKTMDADYKLTTENSFGGWGLGEFLSTKKAKALSGDITFTAHVFVESVELGEDEENTSLHDTLLCARLADLQDDFTSSIDKLYSNRYFFSDSFRKSLARELQGSRGGIGLPGNIASHVPVGVLRKLRTNLPLPIAEYRNKVLEECSSTTEAIIENFVGIDRHPKLQSVLVECAEEIFNTQAAELERYHDKILEWEENVCSSNHYFMDTVNSIRSTLYESEDEEKPLYLRHLTAEAIARMSNEDQKLVDQQIELFAYWKLMKKRLIDYVLLSTHGELVSTPIHKKLKPAMLDVVFRRDDAQLVHLLSADEHTVKTRANVVSRLEKLNEALREIDEYKAKHPGGLVEID
jgi:GTPase SAR1 family protein